MSEEHNTNEPSEGGQTATEAKEGVPGDVFLGAGIEFLHWIDSNEDEEREDKTWHEQREKDEAEARMDAREARNDYKLPAEQPYASKMPYPVPKDWDWRRVKREEDERQKQKLCGEGAEHHDKQEQQEAEEPSEEERIKALAEEGERRRWKDYRVRQGDLAVGEEYRHGRRSVDMPNI